MLDALTAVDFAGTEGQIYAATPDGLGTVPLELVSVTAIAEPRPFSLLFLGPVEPQLPQGTYPLTHPGLGTELALFLVPVGRADAGVRYEAIFG